jgi:putative Mg2+ transporter-C (MgtC) family protein
MRTYGFVCMASAALTVIVGHPLTWYGGHPLPGVGGDPTRVIQGIVTGVGFLGAGVIMKDGFSITGLTTAASIWTASAIGVTVGLGFYAAAFVLTVLSTIGMLALRRIELLLPSHGELVVRLRFAKGELPSLANLRLMIGKHGYDLVEATLAIVAEAGTVEWHFLTIAQGRNTASLDAFAGDLSATPGIEAVQMSRARN